MSIFDWASSVRFLILFYFRADLVESFAMSYWHPGSIGYSWDEPWDKGAHHFRKISKKMKKVKKPIFWSIAQAKWLENSIKLIKSLFQWLVEQDVSSSARRVIRCQGKSSRRGLATFWDLLRWNVNFWLSSIRSIFDFILFSGRSRWELCDELLTFGIYRLFVGWTLG